MDVRRAVTALDGRFALALAISCAACVTVPRAPDEGGPLWVRVESPHFIVESDLKEKQAIQVAVSLERWRVAMAAALFPGAREPRGRLHVVALREGEIQATNPQLAGMYSDQEYVGPSLLLGGGFGSDPDAIIKHELAHAVIHENIPAPPQWLNEGMAVFLESTTLDDDGVVEWGARTGRFFSFHGLTVTNLEGLFDPRPWPAANVTDAEFIAGRLLRTLAGNHPLELACFVARLRAYDEPKVAMDACFLTRPGWPSEISSDGWERAPAVGRARVTLPDFQPTVSRMADADVHAALALVSFRLAGLFEKGEPARAERLAAGTRHLQRALELEPSQPLAAALVAADEGQDVSKRLAFIASLTRTNPSDWRGWALRASFPATDLVEGREAARRAFALRPDRAEVLFPLAGFAADDQEWKTAAMFAREAALLLPRSVQPRALWFLALERMNDCAGAAGVARYGMGEVRAALGPALRATYVKLELGAPRCPLP